MPCPGSRWFAAGDQEDRTAPRRVRMATFPPCAVLSVSLTRKASLPQLRQRRPRVEQRSSSSSWGVASRRGTERLRLRGGQLADDETVRCAGWEHPACQRRDRAECRAHRSGMEIVCQSSYFPSTLMQRLCQLGDTKSIPIVGDYTDITVQFADEKAPITGAVSIKFLMRGEVNLYSWWWA